MNLLRSCRLSMPLGFHEIVDTQLELQQKLQDDIVGGRRWHRKCKVYSSMFSLRPTKKKRSGRQACKKGFGLTNVGLNKEVHVSMGSCKLHLCRYKSIHNYKYILI